MVARTQKKKVIKRQLKQQQPQRRKATIKQNPRLRGVDGPIVQGRQSSAHHYDAFASLLVPQPIAYSVGPANFVAGMDRMTITTGTEPVVVLFAPRGGRTVGICTTYHATTPVNQTENLTMNTMGIDGGPSQSSPDVYMLARGSVRLRNFTKASDVEGIVRVMRIATGLDYASPPSAIQMNALMDLVKGSVRSITNTGATLTALHQWNSIPVDQSRYHQFVSPGLGTGEWSVEMADPAMATLAFIFEATTAPQSYEFSCACNAYARYRFAGPLSNSASAPPTTSNAIINAVRDGAESIGSMGMKVGEQLASSAMNAAGGYLGTLQASSIPYRQNPVNMLRLAGPRPPLMLMP